MTHLFKKKLCNDSFLPKIVFKNDNKNGNQHDCVNRNEILKQHEVRHDHMMKWKDFSLFLKRPTTDATEKALLEAEKNHWRDVLICLINIIQFLAKRKWHSDDQSINYIRKTGKILKEVELIAKFDPVLNDHVRSVEAGAEHVTYLQNSVQNDLIKCISDKFLEKIMTEVKESNYYAIILGCTPDVSPKTDVCCWVYYVSVE